MIYDAVPDFHRVAVDFSELDPYIEQDQAMKVLVSKGAHAIVSIKDGRVRPTTEVICEAIEWTLRNSHFINYKRGAKTKQSPRGYGDQSFVDCSSFAKWAYARGGIRIPRRSIQQRNRAGRQIDLEELQPGCLLFKTGMMNHYETDPNDGVGHVGIYLKRGIIVHAVSQSPPIVITLLDEFIGKGRIFRGAVKVIANPSRTYTFEFNNDLEIETSDDIKWMILRSI